MAYLTLSQGCCEVSEKGNRHYICNIFVYKYYISLYKVPDLSTAAGYVQRYALQCLSVCEAGGSGSEELKRYFSLLLLPCESRKIVKENPAQMYQ